MGDISLEVKRLKYVAYHLPPSNAEVEIMWRYTSTSSYAFITSIGISKFGGLFIVALGPLDWS
jgi:hypothetical protein